MPVKATTTPQPVSLAVAGKSAGDPNMAIRKGNWWTFSGKTGWVILDACPNSPFTDLCNPHPICGMAVRATNATASPKSILLEEFIPCSISPHTNSRPDGETEDVDVIKEFNCPEWQADHKDIDSLLGRWAEVVKETFETHDPEPRSFSFPPSPTRFWRFSVLTNFGSHYVGVNHIEMKAMDVEFSPILHGPEFDFHRSQLSLSVEPLRRLGCPGAILVFGTRAFPISGTLPDKKKTGINNCLVAGSSYNKGRVMAFGHESYMYNKLFEDISEAEDSNDYINICRFIGNSINWVCGYNEGGGSQTRRIAILGISDEKKLDFFKANIHNSTLNTFHSTPPLSPSDCRPPTPPSEINVEIVHGSNDGFTLEEIRQAIEKKPEMIYIYIQKGISIVTNKGDPREHILLSYISGGGGIITSLCPWGWQHVSGPNANLRTTCLLNHILEETGMVFTGNYLWGDGSIPVIKNINCVSQNTNNSLGTSGKTGDALTESTCECRTCHVGDAVEAVKMAKRCGGSVSPLATSLLAENINILPPSIIQMMLGPKSLSPNNSPPAFPDDEINITDQDVPRGRVLEEFTNPSECYKLNESLSLILGDPSNIDIKFPIQPAKSDNNNKNGSLSQVTAIAGIAVNDFLWSQCAPQMCPKSPSADDFPGSVDANIPRVENFNLEIEVEKKGWQSTGIYICPGECCEIELDLDKCANLSPLIVKIRIGCHSDKLGFKETLNRWPSLSVCSTWDIGTVKTEGGSDSDVNNKVNQKLGAGSLGDTISCLKSSRIIYIGSPHGGLLYFEVTSCPKSLPPASPDNNFNKICIKLTGAGVLAPYFSIDRCSEDVTECSFPSNDYPHNILSWKERLDTCVAPWGEIEGRNIILSLPRDTLMFVEDPMEVVSYWDSILEHELTLSHQSLERKERLVTDRQIGGGYMHSGYPVMTHLDITKPTAVKPVPHVVNVPFLKAEGSWGVFHEFGHNRQKSEWTFEGTGEVTVNLFSLYCYYKTLNQTPFKTSWFRDQIPRCLTYLSDDSKTFENSWKVEPGLALGVYASLIERFGFELISTVLLTYELMDSKKKPKSNSEKINTWVQQTSLLAGQDLRPLYRLWKWPLDEEFLSSLDELPLSDWSSLKGELESNKKK